MGSQSVEIIRQGVWASLTGGWYYDPHQNDFCNIFHLYLWLFLMCVPFCVYLYASWWWIGWITYLAILGLVAFTVKGCNYLLHHMFDTGECLQEEVGPGTPTLDAYRPSLSSQNASSIGHQRASSFEALEMQVVSNRGIENATPPVGCSSRNSVISSNNLASSVSQATPAVIDLKVDVHHKDSSGSEEGTLKATHDTERKASRSVEELRLSDQNPNEYPVRDLSLGKIENSLREVEEIMKTYCDQRAAMHELRTCPRKQTNSKESQPARHRKKPKHDTKVSSLTRTSDLEDCLASTKRDKNVFVETLPKASTSLTVSTILENSGPSTSRSCRATPDPLLQSRALSIAEGERSCSVPNCSLDVSSEGCVTSNFGLAQRLSFGHEDSQRNFAYLSHSGKREREKGGRSKDKKNMDGNSPRKKGKDDTRSRVKEKEKNKISDVESEEDPNAKDSSSPLLMRSQHSSESSTSRKNQGQRMPSSRPYHPLVCRRTTSLAKDALKVTTLTFENVYADEDPEDNPQKGSSSCSSDEAGESSLTEANNCSGEHVHVSQSYTAAASVSLKEVAEADSLQKDREDSSSSVSSSCPDIEWLFCHSESDSEFSNVAKNILSQQLKKGDSSSTRGENDEEEEDSWTAIRSSPEAEELPSEDARPNLREIDGVSKHGAIPKQRRQGVVVRDGEDGLLPPEGEAAGVTMDLVRKMLDVFNSYPDSRPRDIKKLLVLVSLEQDNRKTNTTTATAAAASIEDKDDNNNCETEDIPQSSNRDCNREINFSEATGASSSHNEKKHQSLPGEVISNKNSVLHRKPAVRRRRNHLDVGSNDPIGNSDKKTHTTLSGAVSYFGNSDDDMSNDLGGRKQSRKSSSKQKFSPESLLPLSAFEGLPAPAIHLATCHDDTTNGAVHCFQDERGHWFTYTFNNTFTSTSSSVGLASASTSAVSGQFPQIRETTRGPSLAPEDASLSSSSMSLCSGLTVVLDSQAPSSPLSGPPWSETSRPIRESRPPTPTVPHRRLSPPVGHLPAHRENERTSRGGILGEVLERGRTVSRAPSSGIVGLNNPRAGVPRDLLSSGPPHLQLLNLGTPGNPLQLFTSAIFDRRRLPHRMNPAESDSYYGTNLDVDLSLVKQLKFATPAPQTTQYYKLKLFGKKTIKVRFDRLSLLAILDRNLTLFECLATAFLVSLVGVLGCMVLRRGFYQELKAFVFCVVMASSQYSLFKSVQPDAASPTHGYNKVVLYSRPVYFCLICSLILGLDFYLENFPGELINFTLYGIRLTSPALLMYLRDILLLFLLLFPLFFSLGLLPQVNTFLTYILEQVDMHIFGGNASTGLSSSVYCVLRSLIAVLFLSGFAYGGLREEAGSQHILYSIFCALTVAFAYHLGRSGANPSVLWQLIKKNIMWPEELRGTEAPKENFPDEDHVDPLPKKLRTIVTNRLMHDMIVCVILLLLVFAIHSSTVFTVLLRGENSSQFPDLLIGLFITACFMGFLNHYLIPQLRTQQPWMCIARPACMTHEYSQFEVYDAAKVMWFEKLYVWLCLLEKNILYPIIFLCALTRDAESIMLKHPAAGVVMIVICGLKCLRGVYSQPQFQYLVLAFTVLFFNWDSKGISESFLVDYFFMSIVFSKSYEFMLKLKFIVTYIAPWQITWGSAFHAFAQPFSVPHSAMLFVQAAISAILSTPLNPILGSAIFITSYVRPVKFWERDYNTKRIDHSNTRLSSLLEQNPGADDNNLNSIFYEHLTRSLQHSLCGDILMGRWGVAVQGDCFVLASDNLNCLVHIIEMGNGLVTFQVRGLEFRGTYCQQREVEAISEGVAEDRGCCCCEPGHLPHMLSANAAFNQRWLAWEVTATKYVLEGYSISDNSATSMFQMFELRKILITYYVKSIIFFVVQSSKLEEWLNNEDISNSLLSLNEKKFADLDPTFHAKIDEDYDPKESGITRTSFCNVYLDWITFCVMRRKPRNLLASKDSLLVSLCLALSLLGRRALGPSSQCDNVEVFLQFLHSLFKGDIRPTCVRDEWVFGDMELLRKVVAPALRISLKLHQDHFLLPEEYDNHEALYNALIEHQATLVICHEGDPQWRAAVLSGRPSLLSLRHVNDDGEDKFKVIMLNKRHLLFRVIKVNRECVRGLWAGQQQELVYLRNRNPERGSIQNAKQALRNLINSSCDQPIGYPIYVSPLTTSYADTHEQLSGLCGSSITPKLIKDTVINICHRLRERCVEGCSSGSSGLNDECSRVNNIPESFQNTIQLHQVLSTVPMATHLNQDGSPIGGIGLVPGSGGMPIGGSLSGHSLSRGSLQATRGSLMSNVSSLMAPQNKQSSTTLASLAGLLSEGTPAHRTGGVEGGDAPREFSHREKSSVHNSRDSLTYTCQRENIQWEAVGTVDFRDKRGHGGGSRGSSMSGITFLSREAAPIGNSSGGPHLVSGEGEWEWEMSPPEMALCTTGSVHSLHSSSSVPHQEGTPPPPPPTYSGGGQSSQEGASDSGERFSSLHDLHARSYQHNHSKTHSQHRQISTTWAGHDTGGSGSVPSSEKRRKHHVPHRVRITDANQVYDTLNLGRRIDVIWPDEGMRSRGGRNFWNNWVPVEGMEGTVIHTWKPHHPDPKLRSHVEKTIYLVQIQDKFVPVAKNAVRDISNDEDS